MVASYDGGQINGSQNLQVVIIGAGLGGLVAAAKLKQAGFDTIAVFEKASHLGGVWRANRYPNVACDTAIDLYGISFYPGDRWSTNFAPGNEILTYLNEFASAFNVDGLIQYNCEIVRAEWDEDDALWTVSASDGRKWTSRFVIWAGGIFSQPVVPKLPGLDKFKGEYLHSTAWSEDIRLEGKRVAIVGSGATAIQIVPYAAEHADALINFVRTPSYVMPRPDLFFDHKEIDPSKFAEQQRERREVWFEQFELIAKGRFPMNDELIAKQEATWKAFFDSVVTDPELRKVLTPNYRFGCKRPLFSNAYYPAMCKDNVTAVSAGVVSLTEDGIVDNQGNEYKVDMVVWATGFNPAAMLGGLKIVGRDDRELSAFWGNAPEAYYGTFVKGFPNLFVVNGPNVSGASATEFIESQVRFVVRVLQEFRSADVDVVEVTPSAHNEFNADIQGRASRSVMVLGNCNSYYRVGGTGKVITHWPDTIAAFRSEIAANALKGLAFTSAKQTV
ncbi:MAG: flavin-containing monooxygenase [Xanthobacteraceae bacterium]|uniref:flavin-containing monooxygenase n=1 Tax=Pseudorhodoplanes sp. TaxID=1934341 RepID=UPI003D0DCE85